MCKLLYNTIPSTVLQVLAGSSYDVCMYNRKSVMVYTYKSVVEEIYVHVCGSQTVLLDLFGEPPGHSSQCLSPIAGTQYQHSVDTCSHTLEHERGFGLS